MRMSHWYDISLMDAPYRNGLSLCDVHRYVSICNNRLPQLGNITAHLENVTADINAAIPNPEFSGLGVLDFEEWFPVWDMNFDNNVQAKHKKASIELVKKNNPQLTDKEAEEKAIEEFDQYARYGI